MPHDVPRAQQVLRQLAVTHFEGCSLRQICELDPLLCAVERPVVESIMEGREEILDGLDRALGTLQPTAESLAAQTLRFVHGRNQFIEIDPAAMRELVSAHALLVPAVRSAIARAQTVDELAALLGRALRSHQANLGSLLLRMDNEAAGRGMVFREVKCAEYAIALQLRVMNVNLATLRDPVLDIGCGEHGALVRFLREQGREAFGIDRFACEQPFVQQADWLDVAVEPARWGTILSHLAFSNHFLHHHLRPGGQAERYAHKYMEILHGLQPGGTFVYSPGLPFMETLLPRRLYKVMRLPVQRAVGSVCDDELCSVYGTSVFYACHVRKAAPA